MNRRLLSMLLATTTLLAACGDDDDDDDDGDGTAFARVVHAVSDAGPVDVRLDDEAAVVTGLEFGGVAPETNATYEEIAAGERRVRVISEGATVIDTEVDVDDGETYTLLATGLAAGTGDQEVEALVLEDDISAPGAGNIRVRIVHAAAAVGDVDVYVAGADQEYPATPALSDVEFRSAETLGEVPAGSYRICVVAAGGTTDQCAIDAVTGVVAAGTVATAIAVDDPAGAAGLLLIDREPT